MKVQQKKGQGSLGWLGITPAIEAVSSSQVPPRPLSRLLFHLSTTAAQNTRPPRDIYALPIANTAESPLSARGHFHTRISIHASSLYLARGPPPITGCFAPRPRESTPAGWPLEICTKQQTTPQPLRATPIARSSPPTAAKSIRCRARTQAHSTRNDCHTMAFAAAPTGAPGMYDGAPKLAHSQPRRVSHCGDQQTSFH